MKPREYIEFLGKIEKLKCNTRHSWTSSGRRESVAEHSWRLSVMAMLCADEYPELNINKVIRMCLVHDFGEAVTGDIPSFNKTADHEKEEDKAIKSLLSSLPDDIRTELSALFDEMNALETPEAKLFKSLDNLEAVVSHNEADISTWIPLEYEENLVYGQENCEWSKWTRELREELRNDSIKKIEENKMEELILIKPSTEYADQIKEYRQEFLDAGDSMDGTGSLRRFDDPLDFIQKCKDYECLETLPADRVLATQFMLVRKSDGKVLGMLQVRHYFNEYLEKFGGHIGYSVRPSERRKGYAKQMLKMALPYCREIGLDKVLITCIDGNIGSEKTILANGGVYEYTVYEPNEKEYLKRFWITL